MFFTKQFSFFLLSKAIRTFNKPLFMPEKSSTKGEGCNQFSQTVDNQFIHENGMLG